MPYMNGEFITTISGSVRRRIKLIDSIELAYRGNVDAWHNLSAEEVDKDIRRGLLPVGRKFRNSRHLRGGHYDPKTSPRNLKQRHPMSAKSFMNIRFEEQTAQPSRKVFYTELDAKLTEGLNEYIADAHQVATRGRTGRVG